MSETRATLLNRVKNSQDAQAWWEFDEIYRRLLVHYAQDGGLSRGDAEEIAQDCWKTICQSIKTFQYDPARGRFRDWLHRIVDNRIKDHFRKRRETVARPQDLEQPDPRQPDPAKLFEQRWLKEHALYCLKKLRPELAPNHYEAFMLYAVEGRKAAEVAVRLGLNEEQVHTIASRTRRRLRAMMKTLFGSDGADY